jgi:hypothetical protein
MYICMKRFKAKSTSLPAQAGQKVEKLKIFFTASYYGKKKYQRYYDLVLKKLEECNTEVMGTEKGDYAKLVGKKGEIFDDKHLHYDAIKKGIVWADAVVVEMSQEDFQLGHEATLAIQSKKHVLCMSTNEDFSKKIFNKYFHGARYNEFNAGKVIKEFLSKVKGEKLSERFNMFLSKRQVEYLKKVAEEKEIGKSEYLRKLISEDMKKGNDPAKGGQAITK